MHEITDGAAAYCRQALSLPDAADSSMRIFESKGCCYSYCSLDTTVCGEDGDILIEADGLKIYVQPSILAGFSHATLDYSNGMLVISGRDRPVYRVPFMNARGE